MRVILSAQMSVVCDALFALFTDEEELLVGYFHKGEPSQAEVPPQRVAGIGVSKKPCVPSFFVCK